MDSQQKQRVSENKFTNTTMYSRKRYITPYSKDKRHYKPQILNCKHFLYFRIKLTLVKKNGKMVRMKENDMTETANQNNVTDARRINEQLNTPVSESNRSLPIEQTIIGPFMANTNPYEESSKENTPKKATIIREQRIINSPEDMNQYTDLAHQNGDNVIMPNYQLAPELAEKIKDKHNNYQTEYLNGNPAAQLSVYFHELAHYNRENKGINIEKNGNSETNLTLNYVDEKSACVAQNLALVNIYNQCKKEGAEYFAYKDIKIKTEELLDMYPNLRECVEKNGSDLTKKETVIAISKTASEQWDKDSLPKYKKDKDTFISYTTENNRSIIEQIQAVKDGEKSMDAQLKDIDIGYGMKIDLPDECKAFIYPDKKFIQDFILENNNGRHPSNEGLLQIDKYLEQRGLKTNEVKDEYIRQQYEKIVNRAPDADNKLKDLMLNADFNPNNEKIIAYTDGLIEKNQNGTAVVSNDNGKTLYQVTEKGKALSQELKSQKGKYPPDASTPEIAAMRAMNGVKMEIACNKRDKEPKEVKKQTPALQNTQQTQISPAQRSAER